MTAPLDPRHDPDRYRPGQPDDLSIVPGLGEGRTRPMDLSKDPDRFDPSAPAVPPELPRGLDPRHDPDRFTPPGQGQNLIDLLGKEGAFEEKRDGYEWVFGLLAVLAFLALVSFVFNSVLSP